MVKIDSTLTELATVAAAINFWNDPAVKGKIKTYFTTHCKGIHSGDEEAKWEEIVQLVLKNLNDTMLPVYVPERIIEMIWIIGKRIYYWTKHIYVALKLPYQYAETIYWSSWGAIDKAKIFNESWSKLIGQGPITSSVFEAACEFVQKDFMNGRFKDFIRIAEKEIPLKINKKQCKSTYGLMALYLCAKRDKITNGYQNMAALTELYRGVRESTSPSGELFSIACSLAFAEHAKFFFSKMKDDERDKRLIDGAKIICQRLYNESKDPLVLHNEDCTELLYFCLTKCSFDKAKEFMQENLATVCRIFAYVQPYKSYYLQIFDWFWPKLDLKAQKCMFTNLLRKLIMEESNMSVINQEQKKVFHKIIKKFLQCIPKRIKAKVLWEEDGDKLMDMFFGIDDLSTVEVLMFDKDMKEEKNKIFDAVFETLDAMVEAGEFRKADSYLDALTFTGDEKIKMKKKFNPLFLLLIKGKIDKATEFLNWRCTTEAEKSKMKLDINPLMVQSSLSKNKKLLDKYMEWQYGGVNISEKSTESLRKGFCETWGKTCINGSEFAAGKCENFLNQHLKPDEKAIFKKEVLMADKIFLKTFCDGLQYIEYFKSLNDLIKYCEVPEEKVKAFKEQILSEIDWWIEHFAIEQKFFHFSNAIVEWVVKTDVEKTNIIKNFLNSPKGAVLCVKVLNDVRHHPQQFELFATTWLPHGDVPTIRNNLKEIKQSDFKAKSIAGIRFLLKILEKGKSALSFPIHKYVDSESDSDSD